ncbi:MAG: hypothetical protein J0I99_12165 [Devosia sp.]|uniref:hypothetical protein n=1 Tax=Devosia sp. TaxID=1871048 RepID=UPI001AD286EB|nr:hypothetical protein [Devosia sp.]MBN9316489.1 hypothetical protein [Devosia sp.]
MAVPERDTVYTTDDGLKRTSTTYTRESSATGWFVGIIVALALLAIGYLVFSANSGPSTTSTTVNNTPAIEAPATTTQPATPMTQAPATGTEATPMAPSTSTAPAAPADNTAPATTPAPAAPATTAPAAPATTPAQ